jgi:hypothetical protein
MEYLTKLLSQYLFMTVENRCTLFIVIYIAVQPSGLRI